ncbi:dihydrolipoyl dehydrogenase [Candidatus Viridilinea mediisalina]|uniref:Dihydrolipoyl dehydrogenase n=1 Tax=Candidatus Viridilinea mediisalina TaxID=2024553 RepID=A0A2A6RPJ1_9CHLR|nr:dihydrolipoyl dehydrogenase [Candidatus Viridilinea mediisalina]PDW04788.1 dihydrolipoyl dehydrogenase [Candidatus Viridilinea mediisalina]
MSDQVYDLVIVGSGPGGYVAAVRAGQLGMRTAIVEAGPLGGVCLNVGCIPTKALLHSADLLDELKEAKRFGVKVEGVSFDLAGAMKHKDAVVKASSDGVSFLMKKNKVDVIAGWGRLAGRGQVHVQLTAGGERTLSAKQIMIATGAQPRPFPGIPFDHQRILSSTDALKLDSVPQSLLCIGAGAIGIEFASMYRAFGAEVSVVEALPRLVPNEDEEVAAELHKAFQRRGIKTLAGAKVEGIEQEADALVVQVVGADGKPQQLKVAKLLVAIGIMPNTKELGLEAAGVKLDKGFILTDGVMQAADGIYAVGDCAATTPWLAHKASAEGMLAVEHMAGHQVRPIEYGKIAACTYCNPEIASVGLTEARAKEQGYSVKVGKFPFAANGKARVLGQSRFGFIKLVADQQYDELLGVHMIGPHVTEMISEGGLALTHEATGESLLNTIHAHPTLYEAIGEAAHALVHGAAIHV